MVQRFIQLSLTAIAILLATGPAHAQIDDDEAVQRFLHSVDEYARLRRHLESTWQALEVSDDAQHIHAAVEERAAAIQHARADAGIGDLFNSAVRDPFRSRIRQVLTARRHAVSDLLAEMNEYGEQPEPAVVNGRFVWRTAAATPPGVLAVLPRLPAGLQYRFVRLDLVLVDVDAGIILDVLPDALELPPVVR